MLAPNANRNADAIARLGSESAFEVLARARALEAQGRKIVHMEIGEPDFETPAHIQAAAIKAIGEHHSHYTPSAGMVELRDAIATYAGNFRNMAGAYKRENVVVSPGAKPIIWNIMSSILNPGDEFVYFDPAYPAYASCAGYLQAKAIPIPLLESKQWRPDLDELERNVSSRTKAIMINSPQNPTGGVMSKFDLQRIAELAEKFDFLVIADEIYSRNFYEGEFYSIAALPAMKDRTIIVDGFSKAYAMTGWRLGYALMPEPLAKTVTLFNNNTFSCVTAFVQVAGITALTGPDEPVQEMNEMFRKRRDRLVGGINQIANLSCTMPEGAFYAFPNISKITMDDKALADFLLTEAGVAGLGGSCFGAAGKGYLRFSYATSLDQIDLALERIAAALPKFTG
ncbi:MAG: pyridoxal phosphate-dependent aminotransferase [Candidatus Eremiobacteraeota bacterium]|nr:pyridoxal phosphate-dependent aminotransferase [Candidatus Eremiobacteraeota bacterium]